MIIWKDGQFLPETEASVPISDRGFLLGDGVFETLKVTAGRAPYLDVHLARLEIALDAFDLPGSVLSAPWAELLTSLCERNDLSDFSVRITISRAGEGRGVAFDPAGDVSVLMVPSPLSPPPDSVRLMVSDWRKSPHALSSRFKTLNYGDNVMAHHRAVQAGFDGALVLDSSGYITGTTHANILAIRGRSLLTPALNGAVLPGTTRARLLQEAETAGWQVQEKAIRLMDLREFDSLYVCNALQGVVPVRSITTPRDGAINFDVRPLSV